MKSFLETKHLIIKPSVMEDLSKLCEIQADPQVMKYIGQGIRRPEEVKKVLEKAIAHQEKHGFSFGSVFERESGAFVGQAGIMYLDYDDSQPEIEVGYRLIPRYWNRGYGRELAKALIYWGFKNLDVKRLIAVLRPENERSRRVLESVGMYYVGKTFCYHTEVAKYALDRVEYHPEALELKELSLEAYPLIQNMARFYVYDMSAYMGREKGWELPADGLYECIDFKKYWSDPDAKVFLIHYEKEIAGFVIIDKKGSQEESAFNMAQFFILKKFQGKGLGRAVAEYCFDLFQGQWEIMVMPGNEGAYRFWRSVVKGYVQDRFQELTIPVAHFDNHLKNILIFKS